MEVSNETKSYLNSIKNRVIDYVSVKDKAIRYLHVNNIHDKEVTVSSVILSMLWLSKNRNETLTEDDILTFLGIVDFPLTKTMLCIDDEIADLTLKEVLDIVIAS